MRQARTTDHTPASRIIYIHGFNSSPNSQKAQLFSAYCASNFPHITLHTPALSFDPAEAMCQLEDLIGADSGKVTLLVGSSLGGYYATYLAEKYNIKGALINPAVAPCRHLSSTFLGRHVNHYTGDEYELTMTHVDYLSTLEVEVLQYPQNFLLLLQTGDEILDYKLAVRHYRGATQIVQAGGNHGFEDFVKMLPEIFHFSALDSSL